MTSGGEPDTKVARLTRDDWIVAATEELAAGGVELIRIERLCRQLNVTKGSFYWHFRDRGELLDAVLDTWRRRNAASLADYLGAAEGPEARLRRLMRLPFENPPVDQSLALSIRLWARVDARAGAVLAEVDEARVGAIAQLFAACGYEADDADARAVLLYAYMRVAVSLELEAGRQSLCERVLLADMAPRE